MARQAVQAVEFEVLLKARQANEPLQRRRTHIRDILEAQMISDQGSDLFPIVIRETQSAANLLRHAGAHFDVLVEAHALAGLSRWSESRRLADVVEKHAPGKRCRAAWRELLEHQPGMNPDVALGMKLRGLLHAFHLRHFWQDRSEQTRLLEQFETAAGGALGEDLGQFVAQALGRDPHDVRSLPP